MTLRSANWQDVQVLQYWDTKQHVIEAKGGETDGFDWEKEVPRRVDWREILIAESDGRPIGVIIIIDPKKEETHYWGDIAANLRAVDIWIGEEADLGQGYGTHMMALALKRCFHNPEVRAVIVDPLVANTKAHRFYERLGFKRVYRRMFGTDDCFVFRLERDAWMEHRTN